MPISFSFFQSRDRQEADPSKEFSLPASVARPYFSHLSFNPAPSVYRFGSLARQKREYGCGSVNCRYRNPN
jgi:hypothetical protein